MNDTVSPTLFDALTLIIMKENKKIFHLSQFQTSQQSIYFYFSKVNKSFAYLLVKQE